MTEDADSARRFRHPERSEGSRGRYLCGRDGFSRRSRSKSRGI